MSIPISHNNDKILGSSYDRKDVGVNYLPEWLCLFGYLQDVRRRRSVSRPGDSAFVRTTIYSFSFGFVGAWNKCAT